MIPCLLFEDDHFLVVNKPAGLATHRAGECSPWGIHEWILNRRTDIKNLGIHQRLDRPTSGVLVFSKTPEAGKSLATQFEKRIVHKEYLFLTGGKASQREFMVSTPIEGKPSKTRFQFQRQMIQGKDLDGRRANSLDLWKAIPETGRTHQVRIHAVSSGLKIQGEGATREPLLLHAACLKLQHPATGKSALFEAPLPSYFELTDPEQRGLQASLSLRRALLDPSETNAFRWIHHHADLSSVVQPSGTKGDGFPDLTVDVLGDWIYVENFSPTPERTLDFVIPSACEAHAVEDSSLSSESKKGFLTSEGAGRRLPLFGMTPFNNAHGIIHCSVSPTGERKAKQVFAGAAPEGEIVVLENGVRYRLDLMAPGSPGLFLDQRENRRRIQFLSRGARILNLFAYTCGFSVAAAAAGPCETVNVDLSRRALEWGKRNFRENGIDPATHLFLERDAMETMERMSRKKEKFDMILMDPPSSSRSKVRGHFSVKRDYPRLVQLAAPLVKKGGWLFCSSNLAAWKSEDFLKTIEGTLKKTAVKISQRLWMPQPFDFPATPENPPYFKSVWFRLEG